MKVKELITYLANFNPNAEVKVIANSIAEDILEDGWMCGDCAEPESKRDIDREKATTGEVYLILKNEVDNPNRCEKEN